MPTPPEGRSRLNRIQRLRLGLLLALVVGAAIALTAGGLDALKPDALRAYVSAAGVWGPLLYIALYVALILVLFSSTVLSVLAVGVFDMPWSVLWAIVGNLAAGMVAFAVGRSVAKPFAASLFAGDGRMGRLGERLERDGMLAIFAARFVIPYPFLNYLSAATPVRRRDYVIGTVLAQVPITIFLVYLGDLMAELWRTGDLGVLTDTRMLVGIVPLVLAVAFARRYRHRSQPVP